jgi:hypothetical protein
MKNLMPSRVPPIVSDVLRGPSRPLDSRTRASMELRFGQDLSGVRVHTDGQAAMSARAIKAVAYTVGDDIVFANGRYAPHAPPGRHLLAHELSHVLQNRGAPRSGPLHLGEADDAQERDAHAAAAYAVSGRAAMRPRLGPSSAARFVRRQADGALGDAPWIADADGATEGQAMTGPSNPQNPDPKEKKKRTAKRRPWIRVGNFVGSLVPRMLGRTQAKYFQPGRQHASEPSSKVVIIERSKTDEPRFGGTFLNSVPKQPRERKGWELIKESSTTRVTGTLTYRMHKSSYADQSSVKVVVSGVDQEGNSAYTFEVPFKPGRKKTIALPNLKPDLDYRVDVVPFNCGNRRVRIRLKQTTTTKFYYKVTKE